MKNEGYNPKILSTPFSRAYGREFSEFDDNDYVNQQLRVDAVNAIRAYHMGEKSLQSLLYGLEKANKLFRESGWPEIEFNPDSE
jgi:hypothetical protein